MIRLKINVTWLISLIRALNLGIILLSWSTVFIMHWLTFNFVLVLTILISLFDVLRMIISLCFNFRIVFLILIILFRIGNLNLACGRD